MLYRLLPANVRLFFGMNTHDMLGQSDLKCKSFATCLTPVWFILICRVDAQNMDVQGVGIGKVLRAMWTLDTILLDFLMDFPNMPP